MAEPFGSKFRAAASCSSKQYEIFHNFVSNFMTVFENGIVAETYGFPIVFAIIAVCAPCSCGKDADGTGSQRRPRVEAPAGCSR